MSDKTKIIPGKTEVAGESCGPECQERLDEAGDGTFPASDPPSSGKSTGPEDVDTKDDKQDSSGS
ncbi:hypothetical protein GOB93_06215 [Acetobacter musti]|uniref:Uncharacterized protein n=1 Tax=Acetobacter musti TaxID=864732 RepID=A0ABX0JLP9_9PROT|nr:hypothetical protein [Acetobacter musti]NHN84239.1 hypothetical protein [Acetobacter musti]